MKLVTGNIGNMAGNDSWDSRMRHGSLDVYLFTSAPWQSMRYSEFSPDSLESLQNMVTKSFSLCAFV